LLPEQVELRSTPPLGLQLASDTPRPYFGVPPTRAALSPIRIKSVVPLGEQCICWRPTQFNNVGPHHLDPASAHQNPAAFEQESVVSDQPIV
jgi:hypothetical protein